jgi:hypothetical protein
MGRSGSGLCAVVGFDIGDIEPSGYGPESQIIGRLVSTMQAAYFLKLCHHVTPYIGSCNRFQNY